MLSKFGAIPYYRLLLRGSCLADRRFIEAARLRESPYFSKPVSENGASLHRKHPPPLKSAARSLLFQPFRQLLEGDGKHFEHPHEVIKRGLDLAALPFADALLRRQHLLGKRLLAHPVEFSKILNVITQSHGNILRKNSVFPLIYTNISVTILTSVSLLLLYNPNGTVLFAPSFPFFVVISFPPISRQTPPVVL